MLAHRGAVIGLVRDEDRAGRRSVEQAKGDRRIAGLSGHALEADRSSFGSDEREDLRGRAAAGAAYVSIAPAAVAMAAPCRWTRTYEEAFMTMSPSQAADTGDKIPSPRRFVGHRTKRL